MLFARSIRTPQDSMPTSHANPLQADSADGADTFELYIDYDRAQPGAARVFTAMGALLEAVEHLDRVIVDAAVEGVVVTHTLSGIQAASLRAFGTGSLRYARGERLSAPVPIDALVRYAGRVRETVLGWVCGHPTVGTPQELSTIQEQIRAVAADEAVDGTLEFTPVPNEALLQGMQQVGDAEQRLAPTDTLEYRSPRVTIPAETRFTLSDERITELLTDSAEEATAEEILVVRKPDYLGNSMWQFRADGKNLEAAVTDARWLREFQGGGVDLRPGDAIRARVHRLVRYSASNVVKRKVVAERATVQQVLEVIRLNRTSPATLSLRGAA